MAAFLWRVLPGPKAVQRSNSYTAMAREMHLEPHQIATQINRYPGQAGCWARTKKDRNSRHRTLQIIKHEWDVVVLVVVPPRYLQKKQSTNGTPPHLSYKFNTHIWSQIINNNNNNNKHLRCGNRKGPLGRTDQTHHRMDPTQWLPDHQLKQY